MSELCETVSEPTSLHLISFGVERVPTLTLPRKRERGRTELVADTFRRSASLSSVRGDTYNLSAREVGLPLPLAGEGWGGGLSASEVAMAEERSPKWKVPSRLRSNARTLRRNSTDVERILWSELRDHRLQGFGFRRQVPIGNYIADFVCHAANLVIELDGGQHFYDQSEAADAARSSVIEAKGFQVLRFSNYDVMTNRAGVLEAIAAAVAERAPTLTLPRKRGRGQEKLTS
jgi:very-short-patch-repair endonuclease